MLYLRSFNRFILFVLAMLILTGVSSQAFATVVYQNPWNSSAITGGSFSQATLQLAGEFTLGADANVNRATWYGTMFSADPLDTGDTWNFDAIFYLDNAGLPGGVHATASVIASVTDTLVDIRNERAYLFDATFTDVSLLGSTAYWFSTINTGDQNTFRWTGATAGMDSAISFNGTSWSLYVDPDRNPLNFTLYDKAPSAVPVPAAVWLFGTALIGLVGFGKRRKAA